jgi:methyl-accepting chemotaxis protein
MKFKSDFFLYSSHLKWMDQKVNEIINLVIKNELKLEEKDSLSKIINVFDKIKTKIFESADTISVSIMSFQSKLEKIREFQDRYIKKVNDFSQVSQNLAASAEELDAILSQFSENMSDTNSAIRNISDSSQTITDN